MIGILGAVIMTYSAKRIMELHMDAKRAQKEACCTPSRGAELETREIHYHINLGDEKSEPQPQTTDRVLQHVGEEFRLLTQGYKEVQGGYRDKTITSTNHGSEIRDASELTYARTDRNARIIPRDKSIHNG